MSACAVLTQRPESLMTVFVTKEYNPQGVYGLRFFKNGKVAHVTVDDWLPLSVNGGPSRAGGLDPLFSKPKDAKAIWVMLIEKAFAKLHHRSTTMHKASVLGDAHTIAVIDRTVQAHTIVRLSCFCSLQPQLSKHRRRVDRRCIG